MRRRDFMALVGVAVFQVASSQLGAQGRRRVHVGYLNGATPTAEGGSHSGSLETLKEGLHQLGWREGETFDVEARFANGDSSRIPRLAAELVARRPDVIVATGSRPRLSTPRRGTFPSSSCRLATQFPWKSSTASPGRAETSRDFRLVRRSSGESGLRSSRSF